MRVRELGGLALLLAMTWVAVATETENFGIQVLPVPPSTGSTGSPQASSGQAGKVTVDGSFADWDLSGSIFACGDVENYRNKFGVWFSAMYDDQNLYLLARWNDDTPMNNLGSTAGNFAWDGDSIQVRVVSDYGTPNEQISVFNCWQGVDGRDVVERDSKGRTKNSPKGDDVKPNGAQQAFQVYSNRQGYVQEIAIPWALITADGKPRKAGDKLVMTIEPNFTAGPTNGRMSIKDIFRAGVTLDRVFTFQNKTIWGIATLESAGHVPLRPVRLSDGREFPVQFHPSTGSAGSPQAGSGQGPGVPGADWSKLEGVASAAGFKAIQFTMPEDGYVSMQILDAKGDIVRQLLKAEFFKKGAQEVLWDGLTTGSFRQPGQPAPEGAYTWRAIWHKGIGIRLRGWASNGGQAPWDGPNPGDNWGGDMGAPCTVVTDGSRMYLGWSGSEAGKALVVTDLDGIVQWRHKRGGFGGAVFVALDASTNAAGVRQDAGTAYVLDGQDNSIYCLKTASGTYVPWADTQSASVPVTNLWPAGSGAPAAPAGMDVRHGKLYLSANLPENGFVAVVDLKTGKPVKAIPVPAPTTVKAVSDELIYVVSAGTRVLAVNPVTGVTRTVIEGVSQASGLDVDAAGQFYVGTGEPDHQVKVFGADGKFVRAIGQKSGRPVLGPWQAAGMRSIAGIALDAKGQLWVTESTLFPRRISVWNAQSGVLVREMFGPTHYGASGGSIDPKDPNVMVGEGCEWRLDPKTGRADCVGVFDVNGGGYLGGHSFTLFCRGANKREYVTAANAGIGADASNLAIYERLAPGKYLLRSTITTEGKANRTTFWADSNGDGQVQTNEITGVYPKTFTLGGYYYWSIHMNTDMTLFAGGGSLAVSGFTKCGAPIFDPATFRAVTNLPAGVPSLDNKFLLATAYQCYDVASGKKLWSYGDQWHGVHGSHNAPPPQQGLLRGTFGSVGCVKVPVAGYVWALNSNVGEWHLLTQDGYYLSRLFEPDPLKYEFPKAVPGGVLDHMPCGMGGEDFGGSMVQAADGKVYIEAGKTALWNAELTGLDDIQKLKGGTLKMADGDVRTALTFHEQQLQANAGVRRYGVKRLTPAFSGDVNADFKGAEIVSFQKQADGAVRVAGTWDDQALYVAWEVKDNTPWANGASDPAMIYLSGDTVDLQLGTAANAPKDRKEPVAGDLRLAIGNVQGSATAVLYRKVAAPGGASKPKAFSSGIVKDYRMDFVDVVADATIKVSVNPGKGYVVEAAIPLKALGLVPADGLTVRGDFGVTHGDPAGQRTRLRTYWSNQHTGIVDDAVYELMMEPQFWGDLQFRQ